MKALRVGFQFGLLIGLWIEFGDSPSAAQSPKEAQTPAPGLRKLTGDNARLAEELDKAIDSAQQADRWDEAILRAAELYALRERVQGPKHFETIDADWRQKTLRRVARMNHDDQIAYRSSVAMNEKAEILNDQGKYAAAEPLYQKALEITRGLFGEDHPDTADGYNAVAFTLSQLGRFALAQPLYEKALEIRRRLLSDDHPDTAVSYNNVAFNLKSMGNYARAQPLYERALELSRRLLGDMDSDTAQSYNNLGMNLSDQGKYALAQPLLEKALDINRRLLTDDHRKTAVTYNNVALNLNAQGRYAQAQPLYEKALEIDRRLLSDDHPNTAARYNNLAYNLNAQGKFAEAQPLYDKALEIKRRLLTDDHPDTAIGYNNVAHNLDSRGRYTEAQPLYEKALQIDRRLLTDKHPATARRYDKLASNLNAQERYAQAQPLYEKGLEIRRGLLGDNHPDTARSYANVAQNRAAQGNFAEAQPLFEKALEIRRRLLTDVHPETAASYNAVASNLAAQGRYLEACDQWRRAVKSLDGALLQAAFSGLERAATRDLARPALAAVLARLGQPAEAWQALEEHLGRGLLDELAARQDRRLKPDEQNRLRDLTAALERLDRLVDTTPKNLDQAGRAKRFEELKRERELASIALGEFQTKLLHAHGPLAGQVARLDEIKSALPADAALVTWVDIPPVARNAADPDGEHWGVVVRARGLPAWVRIGGSGNGGHWTNDDKTLAPQVRTLLRSRPGAGSSDLPNLTEKLRIQRLGPLAKVLGATALGAGPATPTTDGLPPVRRLIVLSSRALAGIPIEALLAADDSRTISYAPSATVFKYLREQPRPDRHAGLLALGDPIYEQPEKSSGARPLPDRGLLLKFVIPGANAATHGVKPGDVLLAYNGNPLKKREDLKIVADGDSPVAVEVWRDGQSSRRELAPGKLGVVIDPRPAPVAIAEERRLDQVLVAARSGGETFDSLPGTRYEVEAIARLFTVDDRPTRLLLGAGASEPELDKIASSGDLGHFGFIHLATHGVIDEDVPARSAVILTQTGLPDPLEQVLHQKPAFDGRLSVREIQRGWELRAELVTLSACETALGRDLGGEGFVGFTQALLMSGARSVCLSLWKVDDTATALLMIRFYQNLLGRRSGLAGPMPKAEALREAKTWLRGLTRNELLALTAGMSGGTERGKGAEARRPHEIPAGNDTDRPYDSPHYWAAFVLVGDPDQS